MNHAVMMENEVKHRISTVKHSITRYLGTNTMKNSVKQTETTRICEISPCFRV